MLPTVVNPVIVYYQTHYKNGQFVHPFPSSTAAFHLNFGQFGNDIVHLNDFPPNSSYFAPLLLEMMQGNGTKVLGMLGGAAPGTYDCLTADLLYTYYPPLRDVIRTSPIATALTEGFGGNLSGFDYIPLEQDMTSSIDWYNAQFYSGFGTFFAEDHRVTAVVLTNPDNGSGYIDAHAVEESIGNLMEKYGTGWGGVGGWEYFNSVPEEDRPWMWAVQMSEAMRVQKARIEARMDADV
ncbi:hypothetical protein K435DRAFT_811427 [Dendrothele bispora CBS 962.96]|uniref:Chitinase n=1 Tax=Dendrothele bispora (strain CBS 962.96) TaxID=1314807 RepID=A0A4S8KS29_DENBC|nr:hypothetical protein K435DRAFT_811427 [Dendrothele bispora CBS 962.96]